MRPKLGIGRARLQRRAADQADPVRLRRAVKAGDPALPSFGIDQLGPKSLLADALEYGDFRRVR